MPAALPFAFQRKAIQWGCTSGPEPHLDDRMIDEKAGKAVGCSSSINAMICNRGNPMDYDGWAGLGLPDWSYAHCLPYFRRMVVIAENDVKLRHLAAHPQCSLVVFETVLPFRGVRVDDEPDLTRDGADEARRSIASRYLGRERGERFAAQRAAVGVLLRLPARGARGWDLTAILPP